MISPIIDSKMDLEAAIAQNPDFKYPPKIKHNLCLVTVCYFSFDKVLHEGQIIVALELKDEIIAVFKLILQEKFPLTSVIPMSDRKFKWKDDLSMHANNTSAFNYRFIAGTETLSLHSFGRAIDINPFLNPYYHNSTITPKGASYDPLKNGTLTKENVIVTFLKDLGWEWGGDWEEERDYHHFEKP